MERKNLVKVLGTLIAVAVVIFVIGSFFLKQIQSEIISTLTAYGYWALFIIIFLVDILPQPLGPEVGFINAKVIGLDIWAVALLALIASALASLFDFYVGKFFYSYVQEDKRCKKYLGFYEKYGVYGLLVSAMGPVPYVPFCWISGALGLSLKRFVLFAIVPRSIRIIGVTLLFAFLF